MIKRQRMDHRHPTISWIRRISPSEKMVILTQSFLQKIAKSVNMGSTNPINCEEGFFKQWRWLKNFWLWFCDKCAAVNCLIKNNTFIPGNNISGHHVSMLILQEALVIIMSKFFALWALDRKAPWAECSSFTLRILSSGL